MSIPDTYGLIQNDLKTVTSVHRVETPGAFPSLQETTTRQLYSCALRSGTQNPRRYQNYRANTEATTLYDCRFKTPRYTPYTASSTFLDVGTPVHVWRTWTYSGNALWLQIPIPVSASDASSDSLAQAKALESFTGKIRGRIVTFQGGVVIGEIKETFHLLRHPLKGIRDLLGLHIGRCKDIKARARRNKMSTSQMLDKAAESWLEVSFGMVPFFSDVRDLCDTLFRIPEKPPDREGVRSIGEAEKSAVIAMVEQGINDNGKVVAELHNLSSFVWKFYGSVDCTPGGGVPLDGRFGLGPENFLPTVWELIPYSFLVDYFTNLGKIVDAFSLVRNRVKRVAYTRRTTSTRELKGWRLVSPTNTPTHDKMSCHLQPGTGSWTCETYHRDRYLDTLIPDFHWKIPNSLGQYLNLGALARLRRMVLPFKSLG